MHSQQRYQCQDKLSSVGTVIILLSIIIMGIAKGNVDTILGKKEYRYSLMFPSCIRLNLNVYTNRVLSKSIFCFNPY